MDSLNQLEQCANKLAAAAKTLADHCRSAGSKSNPHLVVSESQDASRERNDARRGVLATAAQLQTLLAEPIDFIQHLASQNQLLASVQWLCEFQVLACIPLTDSVPAKDIADLAGVPKTQLLRVVRMTATAGFLCEPETGLIAHTSLSAPFVTKLSYVDATLFLAKTAAPAALQMAAATATQRHYCNGESERPSESSAYAVAFNTSQTFQSACEQQPKLQRQWSAYRQCAGEGSDDTAVELLCRLNWQSLGSARIVDVGPHTTSTVTTLAELYPSLRFVVQTDDPATLTKPPGSSSEMLGPCIEVQKRIPGSTQTVKDAAVYILRLRPPVPLLRGTTSSSSSSSSHLQQQSATATSLSTYVLNELQAHAPVLRSNKSATLILTPRLVPEPGSVDPDVEALARVRDLSRLQLTNDHDMDMDMAELVDIINGIHDSRGRMVVVNKLRLRRSAAVVLGVKYQTWAGGQHHIAGPTLI